MSKLEDLWKPEAKSETGMVLIFMAKEGAEFYCGWEDFYGLAGHLAVDSDEAVTKLMSLAKASYEGDGRYVCHSVTIDQTTGLPVVDKFIRIVSLPEDPRIEVNKVFNISPYMSNDFKWLRTKDFALWSRYVANQEWKTQTPQEFMEANGHG